VVEFFYADSRVLCSLSIVGAVALIFGGSFAIVNALRGHF